MDPTEDPAFDTKLAELKQAHAEGKIVGLKDVADIGYRREIDVLLNDYPDTFNLFLIALDELQDEDSTNIMGYYQIAGIHGYPSDNWFNIPGRHGVVGDPGYCVHGQESFPTWHRPYLAMLEQALFIKMFDLADKYAEPLKTNFRRAAHGFRLPYYDYWRPRRGPGSFTFPGVIENNLTVYNYDYSAPLIFTAPTVTVRYHPDGASKELTRNPLNHYLFRPETGQLTTTEWDNISRNTTAFPRDRTVRHPTSATPDNPDRLNSVLNELRMDANRLGVTLITSPNYGDYSIFSTNGDPGAVANNPAPPRTTPLTKQIVWGSSGSLEAIHGMYHVFFGGWGVFRSAGHISQVPCAAFDPIFWGHHGQIERLFSIWQDVHKSDPNNWFATASDADAPLLPFLKPTSVGASSDDFWNSTLSRDCKDFGYTYTDLDAHATLSLAEKFSELYSWSIPQVPGAPTPAPPADMVPINVDNSEFFQRPKTGEIPTILGLRNVDTLSKPLATHIEKLQAPLPAEKSTTDEKTTDEKTTDAWDWYVDDRVERLALNTSFTISYFVLQSPDTTLAPSADFALDPALVGVSHVFASPIETCTNCADQAAKKIVIRNTIPITSQLLDYVTIGELPSMHPEHVKPFLVKRLKWRIVKADGTRVDPRGLESLRVNVSSRKIQLDSQTLKPVGGVRGEAEYAEYPDVVEDIKRNASGDAGHMVAVEGQPEEEGPPE